MNKIKLCEKLKKTIRKLVVEGLINGQQAIFTGTGVVVDTDGTLLTANHVVTILSKLSQPRIAAYGIENIPDMDYRPRLMDVSMSINMPNFAKPLEIDLAILEPLKEIKNLPYLELAKGIVPIGTEVLMAGFPDEISSPLNFGRMLNYDNPELAEKKKQIETLMETSMRLFMAKSGTIGGMFPVNISGEFKSSKVNKPIKAEGAVYWIDNASNHGASGGAVIDSSGKLIGIICEKGLTKQSQGDKGLTLIVPAGSTMALSHQLISWGLTSDFTMR